MLAGLGLAVLVAFAAMGIVPFLGADAAAFTPASSADTTSPTGADAQRSSSNLAIHSGRLHVVFNRKAIFVAWSIASLSALAAPASLVVSTSM
jgi:hypothetical protein